MRHCRPPEPARRLLAQPAHHLHLLAQGEVHRGEQAVLLQGREDHCGQGVHPAQEAVRRHGHQLCVINDLYKNVVLRRKRLHVQKTVVYGYLRSQTSYKL